MFLGSIDIFEQSCSNKYIRNIITGDTDTYKSLLWTNVFRNINWNKAWRICEIYCLNNKVKFLHVAAKSVLVRFNLDIDYSCDLCSKSIVHLFCNCVHKDFLGGYGKFH